MKERREERRVEGTLLAAHRTCERDIKAKETRRNTCHSNNGRRGQGEADIKLTGRPCPSYPLLPPTLPSLLPASFASRLLDAFSLNKGI